MDHPSGAVFSSNSGLTFITSFQRWHSLFGIQLCLCYSLSLVLLLSSVSLPPLGLSSLVQRVSALMILSLSARITLRALSCLWMKMILTLRYLMRQATVLSR